MQVLVALDTETCLLTEFDKAPPLVCVQAAGEDGSTGLWRWDHAKQTVAQALTRDVLVGAHIAYDLAVCGRQWPDLVPLIWQAYSDDRIWDIQVGQKLIDIASGEGTKHSYALAALAEGHLGIVLDKETHRTHFGELREVPVEMWPAGAAKYAIDDAVTTLKIAQKIWPFVGPDIFRQSRHAWWAYLMGVWGVRTDLARVQALETKLITDRDRVWAILKAEGIIRPNGTQDTKKTRARMLDIMGVRTQYTEPSAKFPAGQVKIAEEQCMDSGDPVLEALADFGSIRKQLSTDIPNLWRGELHTRYDSLKETGRMGSGGKDDTSPTGTAFNLTNLPRSGGIRECFVPRPGKVFWDADYAALEAYTGAQCCLKLIGESSLAGLLNAGEDYHIHTAAAYLGISYDEGMRRKAAKDPVIATMRQFAKIYNYALAGGGGRGMIYRHAQTELKKDGKRELAQSLTQEQSDKLWAVWRERYPEWRKYFARTSACIEGGGYQMEQLFSGRLRTVTGGNAYATVNNGYFQGLGSDAAKDAGWRIARECYDPTYEASPLHGSRIVIFGHDSFTGEVDPEQGHDAAMRAKELMEGVSETWCPDLPLKTEPCLTTCLSKAAEAVYDKDGRLIPWSPPLTTMI